LRIISGGFVRGLLAVLSLCWTGLGLLLALQILLPARTFTLWFFTVLAKESSLLLAAFASFGLVLAALARFSGARKAAMAAAALGTAAICLSLVPAAQAWRTASAEGTPLSPSGQFADFSSAPDRSPETVTYASPRGEELGLEVWRPSRDAVGGSQERPAVVMVHGGGWHTGTSSKTPLWDAWLAERGYVVFDIDYRLAPPPRWQDAPGDVKCAVGWVKKNAERYGVDPERIALVGYSAGGHLALLSAYTEDDSGLPPGCGTEDTSVSAVAAFYPPTDLRRLYEMKWPWSRPNFVGLQATKRFLGGTPDTVPDRYRLSSPTVHVDPGDPPTFLVHGGADRVVPIKQSELLAQRLEKAGVSHRLLELPWANHSFDHATDLSWRGSGAQITRPALVGFLERHLAAPSGQGVSQGKSDPRGNQGADRDDGSRGSPE
jgi:acetyl esterase/lipase